VKKQELYGVVAANTLAARVSSLPERESIPDKKKDVSSMEALVCKRPCRLQSLG